jgi:hypothetical protein
MEKLVRFKFLSNKTGRVANYRIQTQLNRVLWEISSKRTIAIVSTKDFNFLHDRIKFTNIISCMMSIIYSSSRLRVINQKLN